MRTFPLASVFEANLFRKFLVPPVLMLGLVLVLAGGCAPQRVVQMAPRSAVADSTFLVENLKIGADLVVIFHDGARKEGQLRAVVSEGLVLGKVGNFGLEETLCPFDQIARVETPAAEGTVGSVAGNVLAGMLLGAMTLVMLVSWSLRSDGGGCN